MASWNMKNPPLLPIREQYSYTPALPIRDQDCYTIYRGYQRSQTPLLSAQSQRSYTPMIPIREQHCNTPSHPIYIREQHNCSVTDVKLLDIKIVYVHGFLGSKNLFKDIPGSLANRLRDEGKFPHIRVDRTTYVYEPNGKCADASVDLYKTLRKCVKKRWGDSSQVAIILVGYSVGGIFAADAIRHVSSSKKNALPNGAKIIGLLAYDTPFFSLDPEFVDIAYKTLDFQRWNKSLRLLASNSSAKNKRDIEKWVEGTANKAVGRPGGLFSEVKGIFRDTTVSTGVAASAVLAAIAYDGWIELNTTGAALGHDGRTVYCTINENSDGKKSVKKKSLLDKVSEYLNFASTNFQNGHDQQARIRELKENKDIVFRCIYNRLPEMHTKRSGGPNRLIRIPDDHYSAEQFIDLKWPVDQWDYNLPIEYRGAAETGLLAQIHMLGPEGPGNSSSIPELHHTSIQIMEGMITAHNPECHPY